MKFLSNVKFTVFVLFRYQCIPYPKPLTMPAVLLIINTLLNVAD